jgi:LysW-gamma-L-lysine carboxypeptidase
VTLGYKGRLLASATATLPTAHSAADQASPGDLVTAWWASVLDHITQHNKGRAGIFKTIQATIQSMSSTTDGLTSNATLEAGFRLPIGVAPESFASELAALAPPDVSVICTGHEHAHATDRNDPVVRALSNAIRASSARPRPKLKTGTADLNVVGPVWRCPIAAYGPGDSSLDHTPQERLSLEEYDRAIGVLSAALRSLALELLSQRPTPPIPDQQRTAPS